MAVQPETKKGTLDMKTNVKMEQCDGQNLRRQSAVGLLLLALLVASPLQGFGQNQA